MWYDIMVSRTKEARTKRVRKLTDRHKRLHKRLAITKNHEKIVNVGTLLEGI